MKKRYVIAVSLTVVAMVIVGILGIRYFLPVNRNNRILKEQLRRTTMEKQADSVATGQVSELFLVDYDKLYVFEPYEGKVRMEDQIGFSTRVLQESVSESCLNYLLVKDGRVAGYLYGLPENIGYCINLPAGEYTREDLEKRTYRAEKRIINDQKYYWDYDFCAIEEGKENTIVVGDVEGLVQFPIGEGEAELLCDLPVYRTMSRDGASFEIQPGKVHFTATDNQNWVQLETEDGITGWFYVENYATIADIGKPAEEVFSSVLAD